MCVQWASLSSDGQLGHLLIHMISLKFTLSVPTMNNPPDLVSLASYVSDDGLVGHHWEERPLGLTNIICLSTGECQGQEVGMGG